MELVSSEGRRSAARSICWNCCKALKQRRASLPDKEKNDDKAKVKDPKDLKDGKEKAEKEKKDKEEKADKEKEKTVQKEKKAELFWWCRLHSCMDFQDRSIDMFDSDQEETNAGPRSLICDMKWISDIYTSYIYIYI